MVFQAAVSLPIFIFPSDLDCDWSYQEGTWLAAEEFFGTDIERANIFLYKMFKARNALSLAGSRSPVVVKFLSRLFGQPVCVAKRPLSHPYIFQRLSSAKSLSFESLTLAGFVVNNELQSLYVRCKCTNPSFTCTFALRVSSCSNKDHSVKDSYHKEHLTTKSMSANIPQGQELLKLGTVRKAQ